MSPDQQLVCFTLMNTNCSALIKVYCKSPKAPKTKCVSLSLPLSPSHFQYSFTLNLYTCVCVFKQTLSILFLVLCIHSLFYKHQLFSSLKRRVHTLLNETICVYRLSFFAPTGGFLQMMSGECGHCLMTMGSGKEEGGGMEQ